MLLMRFLPLPAIRKLLIPCVLASALVGVNIAPASAATGPLVVAKGDLAVSLLSGEVDEYTSSGTFVQKLMDSSDGLGLPTGSAFDGNGNLYVTDFSKNQILRRDALTGAVTVFASNTSLGNGHTFNSPESIVFNRGYTQMLVSDANRDGSGGGINVVDMATGAGVGFYPLPSSSGSEGTGESDWLAFDANSNLFMTNENPTQGIMKIDTGTGDVVLPSFAPNLPNYGYALSFDKSGNLWLGDTDRILEFNAGGTSIRTITNSSFSQIFAAVFNPTGDQFYAGDLSTGSVFNYDLGGNLVGNFNTGSGVSGLSVAGAAVPPNVNRRYVALGDSVPYGHGLVNPGFKSVDGFPPQQGPSALAYPSLLASSLGLTLNMRSSGCKLDADNLAVSGADSDRADTETPDNDCPSMVLPGGIGISRVPHKAVDPEELGAANLTADQPALVSIQVGADDINFGGCLESELQLPGIPFATHPEACLQGLPGQRSLSKDMTADLAELRTALNSIITQVEKAAPHASILLVDYYQIVPGPKDPLFNDGSFICTDLRFAVPGSEFRTNIYNDAQLLLGNLNATIRHVADSHPEVVFADIAHVFDGHAMCSAPNGSSGTSRIFTEAWRAAHPTALGQQEIADRLEAICAAKGCSGR
jgi:hypothetical protein